MKTPRTMNAETESIPARDTRDTVRQSAVELFSRLQRVTWLAVFYSLIVVTCTAQDPPPKAVASPAAALAKKDLSLAPAMVDVNPVARDE